MCVTRVCRFEDLDLTLASVGWWVMINRINDGSLIRHNCTKFSIPGTMVYTLYCIFCREEITDVGDLSFWWKVHFWFFLPDLGNKSSLALLFIPPNQEKKIKSGLFIKSLDLQRPRGRVNCQTCARTARARDVWRKFTEIYGKPRSRVGRAPCSYAISSRPRTQ